MKIIPVSNLYGYNYSVNIDAAVRQQWHHKKQFSCINYPKKSGMFLYFDGCSGEYIMKSGEHIFAPDGSLVYVPATLEYILNFFGFKSSSSCTVGINFSLYDEFGIPFALSKNITVFSFSKSKLLIEKIINSADSAIPCFGIMKAGMYEIISTLSRQNIKLDSKFSLIKKAIEYLEKETRQDLSVTDLASLCHVSECYFRKLFKEYSGMSPVKYKIVAKIKRAKDYLEYTSLNTSEIASLLGFSDTAFFCKQFKAHTGQTPLEYRSNYL